MKLLAVALIGFSTHLATNEKITISVPFKLNDKLVKASKAKDASTIFGEHILQTYSQENMFICGTTYLPTPDERLKNAYESGLITIVNEFYPTGRVKSYTPIRQLVSNPVRSALYDGYYFVLDNR